jgi:plasmid stability protein
MPGRGNTKLRKIHINLPEEVHKKLRVKAALEDVSIQAFVASVVAAAVSDVRLPRAGRAK